MEHCGGMKQESSSCGRVISGLKCGELVIEMPSIKRDATVLAGEVPIGKPATTVECLSKVVVGPSPVNVVGRVCHKSGISKAYPAARLQIADMTGKLDIVCSGSEGLQDISVDDVVLFENVVVKKAYRGEGVEAYYEAAGGQKRRRSIGGATPVVSRALKKQGPDGGDFPETIISVKALPEPTEVQDDVQQVVCECLITEIGPLELGEGSHKDRREVKVSSGGWDVDMGRVVKQMGVEYDRGHLGVWQ